MQDYLAVRFTSTTKEVWLQFELIAIHCKRANKNNLLLDFIGAYGYGEIYPADRYFFGEQAQIFACYKLAKIAVVARPEQVDPEKFADLVAQNRRINLRTFTNLEDAEKWLLK